MKEVWFVAIRPKKLAFPIALVSYGRISYRMRRPGEIDLELANEDELVCVLGAVSDSSEKDL